MKTCWFIVIESMGTWWVDCEGKAYGPFETRDDAQHEARRIALTYGNEGRRSQVYTAGDDGRHHLVWTAPA
jgi:hypothetical protein